MEWFSGSAFLQAFMAENLRTVLDTFAGKNKELPLAQGGTESEVHKLKFQNWLNSKDSCKSKTCKGTQCDCVHLPDFHSA